MISVISKMAKTKKKSGKRSRSRRISLKLAIVLIVFLALWGSAAEWYVHHSRKWLDNTEAKWPLFVTSPLNLLGNPLSDITDGLGLTGHDAVYEYDEEAPHGSVTFAGLPKRINKRLSSDTIILNRGEFTIGWSPSLQHAEWVAYHVTAKCKYEDGKRPGFRVDKSAPSIPKPEDYRKSGFDRGHMAPNHAIVSRYGDEERLKTFAMSNIAPQTPALNRAVWRDLEHRIADLWTARYGEIWVVVGAIPSTCEMKIGPGIDVPSAYYQIIMAQEKMDVRALAVLLPNNDDWNMWASRYIVTIDELEELTGYDFNPSMPEFIQNPIEAELPTRLWPVKPWDIFKQIISHYNY